MDQLWAGRGQDVLILHPILMRLPVEFHDVTAWAGEEEEAPETQVRGCPAGLGAPRPASRPPVITVITELPHAALGQVCARALASIATREERCRAL